MHLLHLTYVRAYEFMHMDTTYSFTYPSTIAFRANWRAGIVRLNDSLSLAAQLHKKLLENGRERRTVGRGANHDGNQDIFFG